MAGRYDLFVRRGGQIEFVYADDLAALFAEDDQRVVRASHVEPAPGGGWCADLRPVGGPMLFANCASWSAHGGDVCGRRVGFTRREDALAAELAWLDQRLAQGPVLGRQQEGGD